MYSGYISPWFHLSINHMKFKKKKLNTFRYYSFVSWKFVLVWDSDNKSSQSLVLTLYLTSFMIWKILLISLHISIWVIIYKMWFLKSELLYKEFRYKYLNIYRLNKIKSHSQLKQWNLSSHENFVFYVKF